MAMLFLPKNAGKTTNWKEVRDMIVQGDVKKIVIVNDRIVEVFLTPDAIQQKNMEYARVKIISGVLNQTTVLKLKRLLQQ